MNDRIAEALEALVEQQRIANDHARVANLLAAASLVAEASRVPIGKKVGVELWAADSDSTIHSRLADEDTWVTLLGEDGYEREKASWGAVFDVLFDA